jgi:sulfatase modifying factor 1
MSSIQGGIVQSGSPGSYTYTVKAPALNGAYSYENKPAVYVNWPDTLRFANWLHNGQPSGPENASTTEDGAYTLNGAVSQDELTSVVRNAAARWWLPNEDEWYKAAFHKNDGATANYWDYATRSNNLPNNHTPASDTGNSANFFNSGYSTGNSTYSMSDAGSYTLSGSPYGTFDQDGSVFEWNETQFDPFYRGIRGGSWSPSSPNGLHASNWSSLAVVSGGFGIGFRVASSVAIPGDFDGNGSVDASDYIIWRHNNGSAADFNLWRAHFGQPLGSGSSVESASVPEPSIACLAATAFAAALPTRRRKSVHHNRV